MNLGIEFFPPATPARVRRRRWLFLAAWLLAGAMVVWPLFAWIGARQTLVFSLPASIAWVVLALVIQFAALVWLYFGEETDEGDGRNEGADAAAKTSVGTGG